jgi:hypothetical protein
MNNFSIRVWKFLGITYSFAYSCSGKKMNKKIEGKLGLKPPKIVGPIFCPTEEMHSLNRDVPYESCRRDGP